MNRSTAATLTLALVALASLSTATAHAMSGGIYFPAGSGDLRHRPPQRYQHDTSAVVRFEEPGKAAEDCRAHGAEPGSEGCTFTENTIQVIIAPNPCVWPNGSDYRDLMCHELGHANGWPADHPNE